MIATPHKSSRVPCALRSRQMLLNASCDCRCRVLGQFSLDSIDEGDKKILAHTLFIIDNMAMVTNIIPSPIEIHDLMTNLVRRGAFDYRCDGIGLYRQPL
ncbi:hypothetical protein AUJ68_06195 [Candidatus Woesearchaeota archaeon CG1_02_57_44]|nr:MAG: hypothetical protein AUJ68_06195 [Candidatus Woesearchaeota archaeon CG1_02_57_44]PIN68280.1 MAG: hypothetical protein COV94_05545 [Candidatus Woesearchaeota archaeon CG11_big_fil_rev_8_21_14_0_20_57_5]